MVLAFAAAPAFAQAPAVTGTSAAGGDQTNLNAMFQAAMASFQQGNWPDTVSKLEQFIKVIQPEPNSPVQGQFEPVYYTLAASYFNVPDYNKALAAFKDFLTKFPKSTRVADATLAMAQCYALMEPKNLAEAARLYTSLEANPAMRDQVLLAEANVYKLDGKQDKAIETFERMIAQGINNSSACTGAVSLAQLYVENKAIDKAFKILDQVRQKQFLVENIMQFNSLLMSLGDKLMEAGNFQGALNCYRFVGTREEVIAAQRQRLAILKKQLDDTVAKMRANPAQAAEFIAVSNDLRNKVKEADALSAAYEKLPDFGPSLLFRYARCYGEMKKNWECIVIYNDILARYKEAADREPALYGLIVALIDVGRIELAQQNCETYLKEFPQGANVNAVGYLMGASAMQANDPEKAVTYFGKVLADQPNSKFKNEIEFMLGNALFAQGKFEDAIKAYKLYIKDFPDGSYIEEAGYRIALSQLLNGSYQEAMEMFGEYVQKYPGGSFAPDARYRLAVCYYAAQQYDKVREICEAWEKDYQGNPQLAEVLALEADVYSAIDENEKSIELYLRSYKAAQTDEVLNYSLFEATKKLQKLGQWEQIATVFEEFVKNNPNHPTASSAMFWIGKAKARTGKPEEAKKFYAETIKKYIDNPSREAVDQILTQLATLCMKKTAPVADGAADSDPGAELDALLGSVSSDQTPTAKARILFAKAELARLRKQTAEQQKDLQQIADKFKPEDLSPAILGQLGDFLMAKGNLDKAAGYYNQLKDDYPKSDFIDYAYNGLGEIAFQKKDYKTALQYFTDGTEKISAAS
ncbi:MAG: tetratricopeptide repeat protein, partial [Verrucomicrobiota bacterium]